MTDAAHRHWVFARFLGDKDAATRINTARDTQEHAHAYLHDWDRFNHYRPVKTTWIKTRINAA